MKLFKYEGYKVVVSEEALMLSPFRTLWERDESEDKNRALTELAYIYFMCDPRSDFMYITDEHERHKAIRRAEGINSRWFPDKPVKVAMDLYRSFRPTAALLLEDTRYAIDKVRTLLREIDLNQTDEKGKPIYTLNTITATIKQVPALIKELDEAEKAITSEMVAIGKARGQGEKTLLEDGL